MRCDPSDELPTPRSAAGVLHELLDTASRIGPEYGQGLASHLPMALHALHTLGASEARLRQYFDHAVPPLGPPQPAPMPARLADWTAWRGDAAAHSALTAHFAAELIDDGRDKVLRRSLPALVSGVAAAAFHGLIRTAHGVDAEHRAELASALAYWACRWTPLPRGGGGGGSVRLDTEAWQAMLQASPTLPRPPGRLIADRLQQAAAGPAYRALAGRLPGSAQALARLSAMAVDGHGASGNFTLLHLVTASHALRVLWPWFDDADTALGHFADAFAAAWLASGIVPVSPQSSAGATALPWPEIVARAIASDDEHVIKLVYTCRAEAAHHGSPAYQASASLAVS